MAEEQYVTPINLNRREAAAALKISVRAVDYLIHSGRLASRRIGGRVLVPYKAAVAFNESDHTANIVKA